MESQTQVRVGVIAGDPLRSVGLQTILEECAGVTACALALDDLAGTGGITAVLLDSSCVRSVPETLAKLRRDHAGLPVVVVGETLDSAQIQAIIAAGAKGYLPGTASETEIRMAMEVVLDGSVWAPRKVLARLIEAGGVPPPGGGEATRISDRMTRRESDVLEQLLAGRTNRQIAESMGVDQVTVKAHLGRMLRKAGVKNRVELTLKVMSERDED